MGVESDSGRFVGRAEELAQLGAALAEAGAGGGVRCVVVEGAPGIGKSALLRRFARRAGGGCDAGAGAGGGGAVRGGAACERAGGAGRVALVTADASEVLLTYALADGLLRALGVERPGLLAPADGPPPGFATVGLRLLEALGGAGEGAGGGGEALAAGGREAASAGEALGGGLAGAPTIVVVDDAQWADGPSLQALLFAARRVVEERLLVVLAVREEEAERLPEGFAKLPGARRLRLRGLSDAQVGELARATGRTLSPRGAGRLRAQTRGNPLYVGALLDEVAADAWEAGALPPAPEAFARRVRRRLDGASPAARALVEAASVLGGRVELHLAVTVAESAAPGGIVPTPRGAPRDEGAAGPGAVPNPLAALEEAIGLGLLSGAAPPRTVLFDHPLTRAAVYHDLGPARRAALHAGAAAALDDPGRVLRHRAEAASGPDPALVATLEEHAAGERRRLAWESSADAFDAAARISTGPERERLELEAVDSLLSASLLAPARSRLGARGEQRADPLLLCARGHFALCEGRHDDAERLLALAWEDPRAPATVRHRAAERRAAVALGRLRPDDAIAWARRSAELAPQVGISELTALWPEVAGLAMRGERRAALALLDRIVAADAARGGEDVGLRAIRGGLRLAGDDVAGALEDLRAVAAQGGGLGGELLEAMLHALLARAAFAAGDWERAALDAERAVTLVEAGGLTRMRGEVTAAALELLLARGELAAAERLVAGGSASAASEAEQRALAAATARLAAARGDAEGVLAALAPLDDDALLGGGFFLGGDRQLPLLRADALVRLGRLEEADALLARQETRAEAADAGGRAAPDTSPAQRARLAGARGRLEAARGEQAAARAAFAREVTLLEPLGLPYELALARLDHGQFLRRGGQRRRAVALLEQARDQLAALGAAPALERCERELAASGLEPAKRAAMDRSALTGRERAVAQLAARGLTNRAIAAELMVSVKTIEVHLSRVFSKLDITARTELPARLDPCAAPQQRPLSIHRPQRAADQQRS